MFCCGSAISLDITFQALKAVRGICVKVVRPRAVMSLACGGRAAAHDTHAHGHTRDERRIHSQGLRSSARLHRGDP
eukprot:scaffold51344_cov55-Phaeocystis_antarctica.AAC.1